MAGDRALYLPCPDGEHVLNTRCVLGRVYRAPVASPFYCLTESCGPRHSGDLVLIDVIHANPDVQSRVVYVGGPPVTDVAGTSPACFFSWTAGRLRSGASLDQYSVADTPRKFVEKYTFKPLVVSRFARRLFL